MAVAARAIMPETVWRGCVLITGGAYTRYQIASLLRALPQLRHGATPE